MTCRERWASNSRPVLSDDPVMCGPAAWRYFLYFHQPVQCFGGSRFDAISGAIPRNDVSLGWSQLAPLVNSIVNTVSLAYLLPAA